MKKNIAMLCTNCSSEFRVDYLFIITNNFFLFLALLSAVALFSFLLINFLYLFNYLNPLQIAHFLSFQESLYSPPDTPKSGIGPATGSPQSGLESSLFSFLFGFAWRHWSADGLCVTIWSAFDCISVEISVIVCDSLELSSFMFTSTLNALKFCIAVSLRVP